MAKEDEWSTIDTSQSKKEEEKVEFEIEGQEEEKPEEPKATTEETSKVEEPTEEVKKEEPEKFTSGAEKRIRQLVRQRKERDEQIEQLISKQKELEEKLKVQQQEAETSLTKNFETTEQQINSRIEMAKDAYKQALEVGDNNLIVSAQENLNNAQNDANSLKLAKQQYESQKPLVKSKEEETPKVQQPTQPSNVRYDKMALDWAGKNPWFGQDQVMTTLALEIDQTLKGEGYDPSEPEFYQEIDNRLKQQYPERFDVAPRQQEAKSPAQVVGGASRTPSSSSKGNKVRLSKEDIRLAEKWGIPLEQYAAEKLKVEKSEGDYTTVYNK